MLTKLKLIKLGDKLLHMQPEIKAAMKQALQVKEAVETFCNGSPTMDSSEVLKHAARLTGIMQGLLEQLEREGITRKQLDNWINS